MKTKDADKRRAIRKEIRIEDVTIQFGRGDEPILTEREGLSADATRGARPQGRHVIHEPDGGSPPGRLGRAFSDRG